MVSNNPSSLGFTPTKQIGIANQTDILVFISQEGAGVPGENPNRHTETLQTPYKAPRDSHSQPPFVEEPALTAASPRRSALFTYNIGQNRNGFDAIGCPNRSSCFCRGGADRPCESAIPAHSVVQMIQTAVILKCHPDGAELQFPFGLNEGTR